MPSLLPRSIPADQQVDPAAILRFLDTVETNPEIEMHSLMLVRHGHVVAEGWWAPYSPDRPQLLYSLSKIFTSTAAAFATAEGLLDLDDSVVSHFPEFDAEISDPRSRSMKLRHVATMASGHLQEMLGEVTTLDPREPVRGFLLIPPDRDPGTVFAYNQPCTYTLASVIQRNAGMTLTEYLRPRLLDPLGIGPVGWHTGPSGLELGFTGLFARTEDVAKLGQLYLQRGQWDGSQLISQEWVARATSKQIDSSGGSDPDWQQGYGFQFWLARHGYRGDGAFGQFCVVLPEEDMVIATTAYTLDMQAVLDAIWDCILPGLGDTASGKESTQDRLDTRLRNLRLTALAASPAPADSQPWTSAPFIVAEGTEGMQVQPTLTSIAIEPIADIWQISLIEASNALTFPVRADRWTVSEPTDHHGATIPVAASGGWLDDHILRVEVIFLETPHRMDIACTLRGRIAQAVWRHPPIDQTTLERLHS